MFTVKTTLIALLVAVGVGFLGGYFLKDWIYKPTPITVQLPPKIVPVEVVKEIKVPGKTQFKVVERVKFQTKLVEVPVEKIKEVAAFIDPVGRVRLEANKFEGLDNGKVKFGWKGSAVCEFAPKNDPTKWVKLVESPFDLTESKAETTIGTIVPNEKKLRLDVGLGLTPKGTLLLAGIHKRLHPRGFFGKALMPDSIGIQAGYGTGVSQIAVIASKEF